tara:strand:+ start:4196 stop:4336 length:141 start_codon:yes stop_codon:yes gene_type:complete
MNKDGDGLINSLDPDSDGVGCFDLVELGGIDLVLLPHFPMMEYIVV